MPSPSTLLVFAAAAAILIVIPGPAVLFVVARSVEHGRRAGLVSASGTGSGALVHVFAAAVGLSSLVASSAEAFSVVKYLGAAYLIALGVRRLLRRESLIASERPRASHRRLFRQAVVVSVLNPKTALFFLAFLPQFVDPERGLVALQVVVLGLCFVAIALVSDSIWAIGAGTAGERLRRSVRFARAERFVSGGALLGLGVVAAVSGDARRS